MKKIFTIFFVTLGVIFFCLLLAGTWFYLTDPLNLKPLLFGSTPATTSIDSTETTIQTTSNGALSPAQQAALETIGIDADSLPSEVTPEQEACFVDVLGEARVAEISAGDSPTATEFFRARHCLE